MAWQQHVADVGLEIDPDTGLLVYREIVVSVFRQNGKTTLVLCAECARCLLWGGPQRVAYSAQNGSEARQKFKEDQVPIIEGSDLNHLVQRFYMSDGNTGMTWKNGSRISVLNNTQESGHGKTLDMAVLDEVFSDKDNSREQALLPTMATRSDAQIWNTSTAGTQASTYLRRKVEVGRAAVASGKNTGIAYFEWSIPDDEDIDSPDVWRNRIPALGVTITEDYLHHARATMTDSDFRRAFGNQWTVTEERVIPGEWWMAVNVRGLELDRDTSLFAIDGRADRSSAAIVAADQSGAVDFVTVRPGVGWLVDWFTQNDERKKKTVALDGHGPLAIVGDDLERAGVTVNRLDSLAVRKACGRFYDGVADQKMQVRQDDTLTEAVAAATTKTTADAWRWHRDAPGSEILMAASLAYATAHSDETWEPLLAWT